jgi:hypothetical protein
LRLDRRVLVRGENGIGLQLRRRGRHDRKIVLTWGSLEDERRKSLV